ncbi:MULTISPECIES: leucine-rich repeat domain-containing protein [unclassified Pseudomonas]|uniref:leucine-rich repeat domain-containing protein n=1 Tax=unclassified Pseudomonas TaxID=196821 RepID=UPI0015A03B27|nr:MULTISPECIES: leucine-rich repeat domain-containing protein [unclassified Pseudomonas]NWC91633.1 leucine-rich repeat domain-containing protein [Pseudomonas sp. IPO3779]NWD17941.1 leucine-rich repeat domain-containing protein [Pseudomonas sp. IPO3778]
MNDRTSSPHYRQLISAVPAWLGSASPARQQHLHRAPLAIPPWYSRAPDADHRTLKALNSAAWDAQNPVDKALDKLLNINAFARPKLQQALKAQFALELDVETTLIRFYVPATIPWFPVRSGAARTWTVSLLDAALHNFEPDETRPDFYERASSYLRNVADAAQFETLADVKDRMSIDAFTQLCRRLDLGGQYQAYLAEQLLEPVASAVLQRQVDASQNAALKAALHMAVMKQDLSVTLRALIEGLVDSLQGMRLDGKTWQAHDLTMMSAQLTGIVLFAPDLERYREAVPVVAYIPDDPEHPIKQYTSSAELMQALSRKLRNRAYQDFFSRFVAHEERGYFFADLNQRLSHVTWHPHVSGDPMPTWRDTPVNNPNLQFAAHTISGNLLTHLYQRKLNKVINDAAVIAVSTASANRKARWERWDALQNIATTLLEIAAFIAAPFFPPLGALMLGYTVYQVLDETFESIIDWAEGLKRQAFTHFMTLMETLVQLGLFAVGMPIAESLLRQALPQALWDFIDRLKPVQLPDGQARLWYPDLTPYRLPANLPQAQPGPGIPTRVRLPEGHFGVKPVGETDVFRLQHPTRPNAYQPFARHNRAGLWHTELDEPLTWSDDQLIQRLGPLAEGLPLDPVRRACAFSETDSNALRKLHLDSEPLPPLLEDQLKRLRIDQNLQRFIDQMNSDDPMLYTRADPQTQLQLLTAYNLWPETKALRFLDAHGKTTWQYAPKTRYPVVQIHEAQLARGDLLSIVLQTLNETEIRTLVGEQPGESPNALSVRTGMLRKKLAQLADDKRAALFDSRYRGLEATPAPSIQALIDTQPGLPTSVAEELLRGASHEERQQIQRARVPARLTQLARWAQQEVRLTRAYEGLFLRSADTLDTDVLILHSLERLPGWSREVRLEVKNLSVNGTLRDSIGHPTAPIRKVLVMNENARYDTYDQHGTQLYGHTDLHTAILQALPDAQRKALGLNIGEGKKLQQALRNHPLPRNGLREILIQHPVSKPAYDPNTMRLPGGMNGYRPASASRTLEDRAQQLFPNAQPEQLQELVTRLGRQPGGAMSALVMLQAEYTRLQHDLSLWEANTPRLYPGTEVRISRQEYADALQARTQWAQKIKDCWRQETELDQGFQSGDGGYRLLLTPAPPGPLPRLNLRMEHVTFLDLTGDATTRGADAFLRAFPALRHLALRNIPLNAIPPTVFEMPGLTDLVLSNCGITLSGSDHAALAAMARLQVLDLYANPLAQVPNIQNLPDLTFLDLAETGISTLPQGLFHASKLDTAIFRDNRIGELPAELFELPEAFSNAFDFSGNPLSRATLNKIKAYYQRTGEHWAVQAPPTDIARTEALYPTFGPEEASRFVMGLPGDLDAGQRILAGLQQEYQTLQSDLGLWVVSQPAEHPMLGVPLDAQSAAIEQFKRAQLKQLLEQTWRRETEVDMENTEPHITHKLIFRQPLLGEYPALRANFEHVSMIKLECDNITTSVDEFLKSFPKLRELNIRKAVLGNIPEAIFRMPRLRYLSLVHCRLRLTENSVRALAGMEKIFYLDLQSNPQLTFAPDVSQMPDIALLALSRCSISEFPTGLLTRGKLEVADLRNNRIAHLPAALYEAPRTLANNLYLSGNPFTASGLAQVVQFARDTGIDLLRPLTVDNFPPLIPMEIEA